MARECVEAAAVVQASREQRTQHSDSDVGEGGRRSEQQGWSLSQFWRLKVLS